MTGRIISPREFARLAGDGSTNGASIYSDGSTDALSDDAGRTISYILSDSSVARDGHTIATEGWQLDNFRRNPVFLFAHDTGQPPVGQFTNIGVSGGSLRGTVLYADAETYPFADTVFRLVKGKFLRAVSVSWDPIKWKFSTDKSRQGGIDFLEQDLLEVSQVPVPAAPGALAQARASGIDTGLLYDWAERVLDTGETVIIPRAELEALRREAKMPKSRTQTAAAATAPKRGLWTVAYLAELLQTLGYIQESSAWEEAYEEDDSAVPQMLADALKNLGNILIAMTAEEVGELVGGDDTDAAMEDDVFVQAAKTPAQRALRGLVAASRAMNAEKPAVAAEDIAGIVERSVKAALAGVEPLVRAGRVLSAANESTLREAHETMTRGCEMVRGVIEQVAPTDTDPEDDPDNSDQARALAKVKVLQLRG